MLYLVQRVIVPADIPRLFPPHSRQQVTQLLYGLARILPHDPVYCTRDSEDTALQKPMPWDSMMWATTTTRGNTAPFRISDVPCAQLSVYPRTMQKAGTPVNALYALSQKASCSFRGSSATAVDESTARYASRSDGAVRRAA